MSRNALIIADETIRGLLCEAAEQAGYAPVCFTRFGELDLLVGEHGEALPALAILHQRFIGDGIADCIADLKALAGSRGMPVLLVCTPGSTVATPQAALALGADQLVLEPVDAVLLAAKLEPTGRRASGKSWLAVPVVRGELRTEPAQAATADDDRGESLDADNDDPTSDQMELIERLYALVREGDYFSVLGVTKEAKGSALDDAVRECRQHLNSARQNHAVAERYAFELAAIDAVLEEAHWILSREELRKAYQERV